MKYQNTVEQESKRDYTEDAHFQLEFEIEELESRFSFVLASVNARPEMMPGSQCGGSSCSCTCGQC